MNIHFGFILIELTCFHNHFTSKQICQPIKFNENGLNNDVSYFTFLYGCIINEHVGFNILQHGVRSHDSMRFDP